MTHDVSVDNKRILIFTPKISLLGGIASYHAAIKDFLPAECILFEKSQASSLPGKILFTFLDLLRYMWVLAFGKIKTVCLNPSLKPLVTKREAVYAFIAKRIFRKKLVIFWRGWEIDYAEKLEQNKLPWFRKRYFIADKMFVLTDLVKNTLRHWGYDKDIVKLTTCFREEYACQEISFRNQEPFTILLLARVEIAKGVFIAMEALKLLHQQSNVKLKLIIAGNGSALAEAQAFARQNNLDNVEFPGYISGEEKIKCLLKSDIFIQPSFSEGLPNSMLEAMACGLPVVTSNVGGIPDFFEENRMGFMLDSLKPEDYADKILALISNPSEIERIGRYNCSYARARFSASQVARKEYMELRSV